MAARTPAPRPDRDRAALSEIGTDLRLASDVVAGAAVALLKFQTGDRLLDGERERSMLHALEELLRLQGQRLRGLAQRIENVTRTGGAA